jgi:hypothetical protein
MGFYVGFVAEMAIRSLSEGGGVWPYRERLFASLS